MNANPFNNLSIVEIKLESLSGLAGIAIVVSVAAKLKHPVRVARFMWCARSTCGRWLG